MTFKNKKVLVIGTGLSGIAATKLLNQMNGLVILYDSNITLDKEEIY